MQAATNHTAKAGPETPERAQGAESEGSLYHYDACFRDPFNFDNSDSKDICVNYNGTRDALTSCQGRFYGKDCRKCHYEVMCPGFFGGLVAGGYVMDCSNVNGWKGRFYGYVTACEGGEYAKPRDDNTGGSSDRSHHSNNDGGDGLGVILILAICLAICKRRQPTSPWRRQFHRLVNPRTGRLEVVEMRAISQEDLALQVANRTHSDVALGYETLTDSANPPTFQFFDATEKDPQTATNLKTFVNNSDWQAIRDFFQATQEQNSYRRSFWMNVIEKEITKTWSAGDQVEENAQMSPMLDDWLQADPENKDCRVLRLVTFTAFAWHARTSGIASSVSEQRFAVFHKRLMAAAKEFADAKAYCREDALYYACGMTIARGLGHRPGSIVTMDECRHHLKHDTQEPLCYTAHIQALQHFCQKWHGSHAAMFQYANGIVSQLPDGHPLWVLIPMAHYERVLIDRQQAAAYWRFPHVVQAIRGAYKHAFPGASETSVLATTAHEWNQEWTSRNYFLYCLIMTKQFEAARKQVRLIGRRPCASPWWSLGNYKAFLRQLGFDTSEPSPVVDVGGRPDDSLPVAPATVVVAYPNVGTMPVASAEIANINDQEERNVPIVSATLV